MGPRQINNGLRVCIAMAAELNAPAAILMTLLPQHSAAVAFSYGVRQWQGENRDKKTLFLASDQSLSYLDGSLAGDYGFDPLGLMDPEGAGDEGFISPPWLVYGEIYNARWAMLGVVGCIFPELLATLGVIPQSVDEMTWFRSGVYPPAGTRPYWTGNLPKLATRTSATCFFPILVCTSP